MTAAYVAARPRPRVEAPTLPRLPGISVLASQRGITQIVHFTTVMGAVGVICSGAVKTRATLPADKLLEYVYKPNAVNAQREKDRPWHDYVNLSVSRINGAMFGHSQRWHAWEGVSWVVLRFSPEIVAAPGVVFTTTNNTYTGCMRSEGADGFNRMFAPSIAQWTGRTVPRGSKADHLTTDPQAEVLYPGDLTLEHLQRIDVQVESALEDIDGALGAMNMTTIEVALAPEVFV